MSSAAVMVAMVKRNMERTAQTSINFLIAKDSSDLAAPTADFGPNSRSPPVLRCRQRRQSA
jgi:hypothetical protein